jgi:hypothetical protein
LGYGKRKATHDGGFFYWVIKKNNLIPVLTRTSKGFKTVKKEKTSKMTVFLF